MTPKVARHRTALWRTKLSRPVQLALDLGLLREGDSFFDYGCGRGTDIVLLNAAGIRADGWDPVHRPDSERVLSAFVNLGFVLNVIEEPAERLAVLRSAWSLTRRILLVAARVYGEDDAPTGSPYRDGVITSKGTFQRLFQPTELRDLVRLACLAEPVSVAPGVVGVFRESADLASFVAGRFRRSLRLETPQLSGALFDAHQQLLTPLLEFVVERGRLPHRDELASFDDLVSAFGSVNRAFSILRDATGAALWSRVRRWRGQDLVVFLALHRFPRIPSLSILPLAIRRDIRALFGSYEKAILLANTLLHRVGRLADVDKSCSSSEVGKLTPNALYIHRSALPLLSPTLRVLEGCARLLTGELPSANVIKLHRTRKAVSYLAYPTFDQEAHPPLTRATRVDLVALDSTTLDYSSHESPPILHRKDLLVPTDYPLFARFSRLTQAEVAAQLFTPASDIGHRRGWSERLRARGLSIHGHSLKPVALTTTNSTEGILPSVVVPRLPRSTTC